MNTVELIVGQDWKDDVRYLNELRPFRPSDTFLDLLEIYDIVDLVVDGTNITAAISEESIFGFVGQLMEDLWYLATGRRRKAIIEFRREPWELVLVPDGAHFLLSLYSIDRRRRVVAHDVRIDAAQFIRSVTRVAEDLLSDLLGICEDCSSDSYVRQFSAHLAKLRRIKVLDFVEPREVGEAQGERTVSTSTASGLTLCYAFDADHAALRTYDGEHVFDLHSLLFSGTFDFEAEGKVVSLNASYPFLAIQSLVGRVREMLAMLESSTNRFECIGDLHHVRFDVRGGYPRWEFALGSVERDADSHAFEAPPGEILDAALTIAEMAVSELVSLNAHVQLNQRFVDLKEEVEELRSWLGDFADTNHYHERPEEYLEEHAHLRPEEVAAPEAHFNWPFEDVRAIYPAQRWTFHAPQIHFSSVTCARERVLVPTSERLYCIDGVSGGVRWSHGEREGVRLSSYACSGDLVVMADEEQSVRVVGLDDGEPVGEPQRVTPGSLLLEAAHYPEDDLVVTVDFHGRVTGFHPHDPGDYWTFTSGHGYLTGSAFDGPLVCVLSSPGFLHTLNPRTGEMLWKVRLGGVADSGPFFHQGRLYTFSHDSLTRQLTIHALFPYTGRTAWQTRIEGWLAGRPSFIGDWMLLPLERHGRVALTAIPIESHQPTPAWRLELSSAGLDRPTAVTPVMLDGRRHGIIRTDRAEMTCFEMETGEIRWQVRNPGPHGDLLFRNLDLLVIRDSVLSVGERIEFRSLETGELFHQFDEVLVAPEFIDAVGNLRLVVGERGSADDDPDYLSTVALSNYLAVVRS